MSLLTFGFLTFGVLAALSAAAAAVAVVLRAQPWLGTRDAAFLLSVVCFFGGPIVASVATPDWNPFSMALLYLPFFLVGSWMAALSSSRDSGKATLAAETSITADGRERARQAYRLEAESQADAEFAAVLAESRGFSRVAILIRRWRRARSLAGRYQPDDRSVMY